MNKCSCNFCDDLYERDKEEVAKYSSVFYSFLRKIHLLKTPPAPFKNGDKVKYIYKLDGVYGCHKKETYTICSQFLSIGKNFWYVRLEEKPSSVPAEFFKLK